MWKLQTVSEPLARQSKSHQAITSHTSGIHSCAINQGLWAHFLAAVSWPLCWWPNSKLILSSPMWQRGRTSGIHSMTKGSASFGSPAPVPAAGAQAACDDSLTDNLSRCFGFFLKTLTNSEEGAQLHGAYGLRSIGPGAFWEVRLRRRIGAVELWVRAVDVLHKTLGELQGKLRWRLKKKKKKVFKHMTALLLNSAQKKAI